MAEVASDTKQCPFCAETIKAAAFVCRYCWRDLDTIATTPGAVKAPPFAARTTASVPPLYPRPSLRQPVFWRAFVLVFGVVAVLVLVANVLTSAEEPATPRAPAARSAVATRLPTRTIRPTDTPQPTSTPPAPSPTAAPAPQTLTVQAANLNLRAGPDASTSIVRTLSQGDTALVLGFNEDQSWVQAQLGDGTQGWVAAGYVTVAGEGAPPEEPAAPEAASPEAATPEAATQEEPVEVVLNVTPTPDEGYRDAAAFIACQNFVKAALTAPDTARFPWFDYLSNYAGAGRYVIVSHVEVQNAASVKLTQNYRCVVQETDGRIFELVDLQIYQ